MRAAIFDLDGVLVRGFTRIDLGRFLLRKGLVSQAWWDKALSDLVSLRQGKMPYLQFASESVADFAQAVVGKRQADLDEALRREWRQVRVKPYWYARELVAVFNRRGYETISISGSLQELLEVLADELGLTRVFGTTLAVGRDGRYTGAVGRNMALGTSKAQVVAELARQFDLANSFGFGDTEQDLPVLEKVGHPVAMNPKGKLDTAAAGRGWLRLSYRQRVPREVERLLEAATRS